MSSSVHLERREELADLLKSAQEEGSGEPMLYKIQVEFQMSQEDLALLCESQVGARMTHLTIEPEYDDDDPPVIDFSLVSLPALEKLDCKNQAVRAVHFTRDNTPRLKDLSIEQSVATDFEYFHTDLPDLESMSFEYVCISDPSGFGKSLSRSPKLRSFSSYKFWGLGGPKSKTHVLVLPNCESLDLYRSDDLSYLKIWAPKLEELNLQACYSITEVTMLDRKPRGYSGEEYKFSGVPSQYEVNLINTSHPRGNITTHERCGGIKENEDEFADFF